MGYFPSPNTPTCKVCLALFDLFQQEIRDPVVSTMSVLTFKLLCTITFNFPPEGLIFFFFTTVVAVTQFQWRIYGMAGMARAMCATLTGAQKLCGKN